MGIDIRNGLQYECIGCAACIDACDEVMDKMGYPRGLIRYTTENALEGKYPEKEIASRLKRPAWCCTCWC
ncbi:cytochrome c oxidase accessory protein CcoG [Chromobacterium violaceum]|uniref:Cytochrome c oxidase accessory protein CcoG n=1 Tax=Chromobacterium violaceum TaxID=536 RepID=A0A3S4I4W7_CHRVL|nr:cytochrome c oxidase accessory protein CcoG [Chromobacterium violaceum]